MACEEDMAVILCYPSMQARHEEFEQQHRQQLQQEEEEARHAAEFKVCYLWW